MVLLQAAIAAGFFILIFILVVLVLSSAGAWIYFSYAAKKNAQNEKIGRRLVSRLVKSIGVGIVVIIIVVLLLLFWNPDLE
ncbi:MAG: hypothetical protein R2794_06720 [Chitinophagales bacterium]